MVFVHEQFTLYNFIMHGKALFLYQESSGNIQLQIYGIFGGVATFYECTIG